MRRWAHNAWVGVSSWDLDVVNEQINHTVNSDILLFVYCSFGESHRIESIRLTVVSVLFTMLSVLLVPRAGS